MNWRERLKNPQPGMAELALNWNTCYIGEKRVELALLGFEFGFNAMRQVAYPQDDMLNFFGRQFYLAIRFKDYALASVIADEIDAIIAEGWAKLKAETPVEVALPEVAVEVM